MLNLPPPLESLLDWLLSVSSTDSAAELASQSLDSFTSWLPVTARVDENWTLPVDRAIVSGYLADCVGYAFAGGYQAALRSLFSELPPGRLVSLCITESGGGHPRAIKTTLTKSAGDDGSAGWVLSGRKAWSTLAMHSDELLVAASVGEDDQGRNRIELVRIDSDRQGVTITTMPQTPFTPEIEHAEIQFEQARVSDAERLPGDGYANYIKPFRTVEDIHISAALLGYLLGVANRFDWPRELKERLVNLIVSIRTLAISDPRSTTIHVGLAGYIAAQRRLTAAIEPHWDKVEGAERERWRRDVAITNVAARARAARTEAAWRRL